MMRQINRLNEEISRWSFEVLFRNSKEWEIAFTNPTAGPWKTIKATNKDGETGEVYRFALKENRPDVLMYNDTLEVVLIIEAKDSISKLIAGDQAVKSAGVVNDLAEKLRTLSGNPYWASRTNYTIVLSILWGSTDTETLQGQKDIVFDNYHKLIQGTPTNTISKDIIIGIEALYKDGCIKCQASSKVYTKSVKSLAKKIVDSLI